MPEFFCSGNGSDSWKQLSTKVATSSSLNKFLLVTVLRSSLILVSSKSDAMSVPERGFWPLRTLSFAKRSTQRAVRQMHAKACIRSDSALRFRTIRSSLLNNDTCKKKKSIFYQYSCVHTPKATFIQVLPTHENIYTIDIMENNYNNFFTVKDNKQPPLTKRKEKRNNLDFSPKIKEKPQ